MSGQSLLAAARELHPLISEHAQQSDEQCHLDASVAQAMAAAGLYRSSLPSSSGGPGVSPGEQIQLIESIAQADGATGWNLMIGMENYGLVVPNMLAADGCADLLTDTTILCSSTANVGDATPVEGGMLVSGRWGFASGCHNSTLFCGTILVEPGNQASRGYAVLTADQFKILDTWHVNGMRGSGSHDIEVAEVFVPTERIVRPIGGARAADPLLRFPLAARLAYNKTAVAFGITRTAIDEFNQLARGKVPHFRSKALAAENKAAHALALAELKFQQSRSLVLELTNSMWDNVQAERPVSMQEQAMLQLACSGAVAQCMEAGNLLSTAAGTTSNQSGTRFNRCLRDLPVVGSHITVAQEHLEDAGRVFLGVPPTGLMLKGLAH